MLRKRLGVKREVYSKNCEENGEFSEVHGCFLDKLRPYSDIKRGIYASQREDGIFDVDNRYVDESEILDSSELRILGMNAFVRIYTLRDGYSQVNFVYANESDSLDVNDVRGLIESCGFEYSRGDRKEIDYNISFEERS